MAMPAIAPLLSPPPSFFFELLGPLPLPAVGEEVGEEVDEHHTPAFWYPPHWLSVPSQPD